MTTLSERSRKFWLATATAGAVLSASMLMVNIISAVGGHDPSAAAAGTLKGAVTFRDGTGAATTSGAGSGDFSLVLPAGAACQGSGSSGYRWETFIVDASVDPASLGYGSGPNPVGTSYVSALFSLGEAVSTKFPSSNPLGLISGIPQLSLSELQSTPAVGSYYIGIGCQLSGAAQDYWTTKIKIEADTADATGLKWSVDNSSAVTTTTTTTIAATTTTTTVAATSTTVKATTTTAAGATTTTAAGATTTSTTVAGATTTSVAAAGPVVGTTTPSLVGSSGTGGTSGTSLPSTGSSSLPMIVWAIMLMVFGRMVVLLARPIRVIAPTLQ
jgi:hypothetical protein